MRAATLATATAIVLAALLTACGGSDDNEPEQQCGTHAPATEGMDKVPATPCRAAAQ